MAITIFTKSYQIAPISPQRTNDTSVNSETSMASAMLNLIDKPSFSPINLVFDRKTRFIGEKTRYIDRKPRFFGEKPSLSTPNV